MRKVQDLFGFMKYDHRFFSRLEEPHGYVAPLRAVAAFILPRQKVHDIEEHRGRPE
jgi:hypothetical protein